MSKVATATRMRAGRLGLVRPARPGGSRPGQAAKTPFVLLVVALLGGGLISLLLLNSALNEGSFQLSRLKKETTALTDEQQALQRDVDGHSAPDALERRARELGLVPGGTPVFLGADGKVTGNPTPAEAPPSPSPSPSAPAAPAGAAAPSAPPASSAPAPQTDRPVPGGSAAPGTSPQPTPTSGR
ncbi:septum formation initiator family protein [Streptomyces sp. NPDC090022]|uniref:FtsB family cell division protein n=1 Tax=Streptomyces sp. NPDC090022 TaxID=3365920 RepID=UPI00380DE43F